VTRAIENRIGAIFIPVQNIEAAREWYCKLLDLPVEGEILFGHLFCVPVTAGTGLVLDSKIFDPDSIRNTPLFHFNTVDIQRAYASLQKKGVELLTEIENGHWFTFKDPDGNVLMVSKC